MRAPATTALLAFLEELYRAAMARDDARVRELLDRPAAIALPHEVRGEALAIAAAPIRSLRAPIRLLQLQQRVMQLRTSGGDPQLELDLRQSRRPGSRRSRR